MKNSENKKYALIVTSSGHIPGVNGLLNATRYYNINVEFHLLYGSKKVIEYLNTLGDVFPNLKKIELEKLKEKDNYPKHPRKKESAWYYKFYRYFYAINELQDYDAVAIFDADMQIVNNIMPYFEIADETEKILMPNNDYSNQEYDWHPDYPYHGAASPPLHCMPLFFKPKIFNKIPSRMLEEPGSDMCSLNNALINLNMMKDIFVLSNSRWVQSHYYHVKLARRNINNKWYLGEHRGGDRIFSFHRRWWIKSICEKYINGVKERENQEIAFNNVKLFWEFTKYFNTELYHKIDWKEDWDFPQNLKLIF